MVSPGSTVIADIWKTARRVEVSDPPSGARAVGAEADVEIASVGGPQTFGDLLYAVLTGQRSREDSKHKRHATSGGKVRRFERSGSTAPSSSAAGYSRSSTPMST